MSDFIMLKNVRCSFPHLFKRPIINGNEAKCGATFLLDPTEHAAAIKEIKAKISELLTAKNKGKKLSPDKYCLRDGNEGRDEYEGYMTCSSNSKGRPVVLAGDGRTQIHDEGDSKIYAGCRVNAKISLWFQDNNSGKRVNGTLVAIQFAGDDEPLDAGHVPIDEAVDGFGETEDDDLMNVGEEDDDPLAA